MSNNIIKESKSEKYPVESQKAPVKEVIQEVGQLPPDHLPERQERTIEDLTLSLEKVKEGQGQQGGVATSTPSAIKREEYEWPYFREVEKILEDNLEEVYNQLPPTKQQEFKTKGEETAKKITQILNSVKVKIKQIFNLIIGWLKIIPGVNKFFLEQEAKIKSDKILALRRKQ